MTVYSQSSRDCDSTADVRIQSIYTRSQNFLRRCMVFFGTCLCWVSRYKFVGWYLVCAALLCSTRRTLAYQPNFLFPLLLLLHPCLGTAPPVIFWERGQAAVIALIGKTTKKKQNMITIVLIRNKFPSWLNNFRMVLGQERHYGGKQVAGKGMRLISLLACGFSCLTLDGLLSLQANTWWDACFCRRLVHQPCWLQRLLCFCVFLKSGVFCCRFFLTGDKAVVVD